MPRIRLCRVVHHIDRPILGSRRFSTRFQRFGDTVNRVPAFTLAPPVARSVAENAPADQPIGDPVPASDADGDTLTYSLWGADADHFDIDASTGQILTKGT